MNRPEKNDEPQQKRTKLDYETSNPLKLSILLEFFSHEEHQNYSSVENILLPTLLANSEDHDYGKTINITDTGRLKNSQLRFLSKTLAQAEYVIVDTSTMENYIFIDFIKSLKKLEKLKIILNKFDDFNKLGTQLTIKTLKIRTPCQKLAYDPIEQLLLCNGSTLQNLSIKNGRITNHTANKIASLDLQHIKLVDTLIDNISTKQTLEQYLCNNVELSEITLISKMKNNNPFFKNLALTFSQNLQTPRTNLKKLTFTLNQENEIKMNIAIFPNLTDVTVYYSAIYSAINLMTLLTEIKKLSSNGKLMLDSFKLIEYLDTADLNENDLDNVKRRSNSYYHSIKRFDSDIEVVQYKHKNTKE